MTKCHPSLSLYVSLSVFNAALILTPPPLHHCLSSHIHPFITSSISSSTTTITVSGLHREVYFSAAHDSWPSILIFPCKVTAPQAFNIRLIISIICTINCYLCFICLSLIEIVLGPKCYFLLKHIELWPQCKGTHQTLNSVNHYLVSTHSFKKAISSILRHEDMRMFMVVVVTQQPHHFCIC